MFFVSFFISLSFLTLAGYIDDKYEIRARHKIAMQLIAISFLSFQSSYFLNGQSILLSTAIIMTLGFLLINGNNLIDGLDTLAIKLSITSSISFFIIGYSVQSYSTMAISTATIAGLGAFYMYNKSPARIYLGEIGGSLLGLIFVAQSILSFHELQTQYSKVRTLIMILMTISYPVVELGISFLRRLYFKKSPFKGDKLHLHYILKSKGRLSVPQTTNIMGIGNLAILSGGLYCAYHFNPYLSFIGCGLTYVICYVGFCASEWLKVHDKHQLTSIFENLSKSDVYLLNSFDLDFLNSEDEVRATLQKLSASDNVEINKEKSAA
jgi:UDP-N-acetylmuramyl pentapeptide phosphotransferase/UDP-N-acetylglucosamine-1-phosphate transferase